MMASALDSRTNRMIELRNAGHTLAQIADLFDGISRQRVHKILKEAGAGGRLPRPQKWPIQGFLTRMREWLWSCGFRKCEDCQIWSDEPTVKSRRCKACSRERSRKYYATEDGQQYHAEYRKAHPEVQKRAQEKFNQRNALTLAARRKARRKELMASEEGREHLRGLARAAYQKRVATEAGREKMRAYWKKRNASRGSE